MNQDIALGLIFFVGAFTMSFAGFGLALVVVPLLTIFWPVKMAVAVQFPFVWGLFIFQAWYYRKYISWQEIKPLAWSGVVGIVIGASLLYRLPETILIRLLASLIALAVLVNLSPLGHRVSAAYKNNTWWGRICGFVSGSFLGAYTIGGPPAILYITATVKDPMKAKALMAIFFSFQIGLVAIFHLVAGLFTWEWIKLSAVFAPIVAAGSAAGFWAFARAHSQRAYFLTVNFLLLGISIYLWFVR